MYLLRLADAGAFPDGMGIPDAVRPLVLEGGIAAMQLASDMWLPRHPGVDDALGILSALESGENVDARARLNQSGSQLAHPAQWVLWIVGLHQAGIAAVAGHYEPIRRRLESVLDISLDLLRLSLPALRDARTMVDGAIDVARDIDRLHDLFLEFGILHQSLVGRALALATWLDEGGLPDRPPPPDRLIDAAHRFADLADDLSARARQAARLGDVLYAAHATQPLYLATRILLRDAVGAGTRRDSAPAADLVKDAQVAEEARLACAETLEQAGGNLISVNLLDLAAGKGRPLREALEAAAQELRARIPHFPLRVVDAWQHVIAQLPAAEAPLGDYGAVAHEAEVAMQEELRARFADPLVVDAMRPRRVTRHASGQDLDTLRAPP